MTAAPSSVWWFHSELAYERGFSDALQPNPAKNVIQWVPFSAGDVAELERGWAVYDQFRKGASGSVPNSTSVRVDELSVPERFVAVCCGSAACPKVDFERMRMLPIYWQGDEHLVRRSQWFLQPEGSKLVESFPLPASLDAALERLFQSQSEWIAEAVEEATTEVIERVVDFSGSLDESASVADALYATYLVFTKGRSDQARLYTEKITRRAPLSGLGSSPTKSTSGTASNSSLQSKLPLQSTALGGAKDATIVLDPSAGAGHRLFRTYAAFYHTMAGGGGKDNGVSSGCSTEMDFNSNASNSSNSNSNSSNSHGSAAAAVNATASRPFKPQLHSFRLYPLPAPGVAQFPSSTGKEEAVKEHVILVLHGVGQRIFRKMGMHFSSDCDDLRTMLREAARLRRLPPQTITILPVAWRAELDLAGNFAFGDEELDTTQESAMTQELAASTPTPTPTPTPAHAQTSFPALAPTSQFVDLLERLSLESIPAVRSVLLDATMDVMLYVSAKHFERIHGAAVKEVRRLHRLHTHWNPGFRGDWSLVGHSLGSALVADLLAWNFSPDELLSAHEKEPETDVAELIRQVSPTAVDLPVRIDKFFAMGSPLGVFHLLRHAKPVGCLASPALPAVLEDKLARWRQARLRHPDAGDNVPTWTAYNCRLFYNLFHPHDPVAHRFECLFEGTGGVATTMNGSSSDASAPVIQKTAHLPPPPPLKIPYHKSGLMRFKLDMEAKIARAREDWIQWLPTWLGGQRKLPEEAEAEPETEADTAADTHSQESLLQTQTEEASDSRQSSSSSDSQQSLPASASASTAHTPITPAYILTSKDPLAAFNHHYSRTDFTLQDSFIENPYLSAISAHFCYWSDRDIGAFIINELIKE